ncbi:MULTISPECIES: three-helix bundle dimerization domain-containing protein [unclassified Streptomyces]|uniref:three-helix bundle dimerization domain-containing protein n=1 Tax=unclassified Streptomyces TaxID=2593676 RepID=UPI00331CBDD2
MGANTAETALPDTLEKLTDHLTASYAGLLTPAVVREVVQDCYQPLSNARIAGYVPILVEHNSRARLRQLVRRPDPTAPLREESDGIRGHLVTAALRRLHIALTRSAPAPRP